MNNMDFTLPGGFPLDQDVLGTMQGQSVLAAKSVLLGGTQYILSGCEQVGSNVAAGYIIVNGEILPFDAGQASDKIIIVETVTNLTYEDGVARPAQKERKAKFGDDGVTNILWADFVRVPNGGLLKAYYDLLTAFNNHTHTWASITSKPMGYINYTGTLALGDIAVSSGNGKSTFAVTIPDQGDANYIVGGSLVGLSSNSNNDNNVMWIVTAKTQTGFTLAVREAEATTQNLRFEFTITKTL